MLARCSVVGTDMQTQKHGNLSSQGRSTRCSDSGPSTVRGATRQGHAGPMMLMCLHLHISPPWYQGVQAGTFQLYGPSRTSYADFVGSKSWTCGASLSQSCIGKSTSVVPRAPMNLFLNVCIARSAALMRWLPGSTNWSRHCCGVRYDLIAFVA